MRSMSLSSPQHQLLNRLSLQTLTDKSAVVIHITTRGVARDYGTCTQAFSPQGPVYSVPSPHPNLTPLSTTMKLLTLLKLCSYKYAEKSTFNYGHLKKTTQKPCVKFFNYLCEHALCVVKTIKEVTSIKF